MTRFATLNSPDPRTRGKLQAALYFTRKKNHNPDFSQVFVFSLSAGNVIPISGIRNAPSWFEQAGFTIEFEDTSTVTFAWATDHWELSAGTFPSASGVGTLTQGTDSMSMRWRGAGV